MASKGCGEQRCKICQGNLLVIDDGTGTKAVKGAKCYYRALVYTCGHRLNLPFIKHSKFACCKGAESDFQCGNIASRPLIYNYHGTCHVCHRHRAVKADGAEDEEMGEDLSLEKLVEGMNVG